MKYWTIKNGESVGPYTLEQLKAEGITADTKVWNSEMSQWTPAKDVPELQGFFLPPIPDVENTQEEDYEEPEYPKPHLMLTIILSIASFIIPLIIFALFIETMPYDSTSFVPMLWMSFGFYIGIPGIAFSVLTSVFSGTKKYRPACVFSKLEKIWIGVMIIFNATFFTLSFLPL